ncbi:G protein coupled glucose receptor regulating Gpa2 protein [Ceratobasidium sp. AG-Ba]|nr:G protein coupled glucose receptor regulating Gpa2 protein [Ceratobasidium sp. AG-Ba]QRW15378.1 G protein coupled glucose receptor regulating Gpa2 protein [Ceratobasidium sp. AG-Ba]
MVYYDSHAYSYARDYSATGHRVALAFVGLAGACSAISTLLLLAYISRYAFFVKDDNIPFVRGIKSFSHSALGIFLYSLLLCDMVQGAAFAINFKWAANGSMHHSAACTAQGAISQVGDLGAAIWSLAIAYYTFSLLFLFRKPSIWVTRIVLGVGWTVILVLPIIGPHLIEDLDKHGYFYGLSGAWCWIGDGYQVERFVYLYMWIFTSLASSIVMYGFVYLRFSGILYIENGRLVWKSSESGWGLGCLAPWASSRDVTSSFHVSGESGSNGTNRPPNSAETNGVGKHLKRIARRLMLYPLVYSIVTIPVAICRLGVMAGWTPPFPLFIFAGITFSSSGLTNVLLFIATRHSFIQQVTAVRPLVHVTTQQVTVLEDARGAQTIHLHDLSTTTRQEDLDAISEKDEIGIERDPSVTSLKLKQRVPDAERDVGTPVVGVRFVTKR